MCNALSSMLSEATASTLWADRMFSRYQVKKEVHMLICFKAVHQTLTLVNLCKRFRSRSHKLCFYRCVLTIQLLLMSFISHAVSVGEAAPEFQLSSIRDDNQSINLEKFKGKVLYIDFWASWCGPCKRSLPLMEELYQAHKQEGFEVVAISLDEDPKDAHAFIKNMNITYAAVIDKNMETARKYGVIGMPTSYLINENGVVIWKHQGFKEGDIVSIKSHINKALRH